MVTIRRCEQHLLKYTSGDFRVSIRILVALHVYAAELIVGITSRVLKKKKLRFLFPVRVSFFVRVKNFYEVVNNK
jgi:hypothetical protein